MLWFWIIAGLLALATAALLARAALRAPAAEDAAPAVALYRAQLREVERDLARGTLSPAEAEQVRTEVSRRLLDADGEAARGSAARPDAGARKGLAAGLLIGLPAAGLALYAGFGAPGYRDLPRAERIALAEELRRNRPSQAALEARLADLPDAPADPQTAALVERLRGVVADRPEDVEGQRFLARGEAALGRYAEAARAQARVAALRGAEATAADYSQLADLLILAAGGFVSPEAETALRAALGRDPGDGIARYYLGLLAAQTGRPDVTFRTWRALLEEGPADAPWVAPIRGEIETYARLAGVDYALPGAALPGPGLADIEAAEAMDPAARDEMIRGMVAGLSDRLAREGGPPADWARLIRAYGVLGDTDQARAIWGEAQAVFTAEEALAPLREAARAAGVAE